jgi:DNA-binding NtrC family response regulator
MLGRGGSEDGDEHKRVALVRQRPGAITPCPPVQGPAISRDQVLLTPTAGAIEVERVGRCAVLINGQRIDKGVLRPGETLALKHQLLLYCTTRTDPMAPLTSYEVDSPHAFGEADVHGIVGESAAAWELRDQLAFCAASDTHALLLGESGSGKELAAQAIHQLSRRRSKQLVSRNAATFPSGIIDAELFGNVRNYPNPGMDARPGLIGEADQSTLFLDEIAELPQELQAHLLRVLDAGGEYQRLGDAKPRQADLRLVAATNRDPADIKHDLLARLTLRVGLPSLDDRRDDIPLIVRHLLGRAVAKNPTLAQRFFGEGGSARIAPELMDALLRHHYSHHVRELDALLWKAIGASKGNFIAASDEVMGAMSFDPAPPPLDEEPSAEAIRASLERHGGKVSRAYKDLGLKSRYALYRLMRKHAIGAGADDD